MVYNPLAPRLQQPLCPGFWLGRCRQVAWPILMNSAYTPSFTSDLLFLSCCYCPAIWGSHFLRCLTTLYLCPQQHSNDRRSAASTFQSSCLRPKKCSHLHTCAFRLTACRLAEYIEFLVELPRFLGMEQQFHFFILHLLNASYFFFSWNRRICFFRFCL